MARLSTPSSTTRFSRERTSADLLESSSSRGGVSKSTKKTTGQAHMALDEMDTLMKSVSASFSWDDDEDSWDGLRSSIRDLDFSDHDFFDNDKWRDACEQLDKSFGKVNGYDDVSSPVAAMMDSFSDLVRRERTFSPDDCGVMNEKMERLARMRDFILQFNVRNGVPPLPCAEEMSNAGRHQRVVPLEGENSASEPLSAMLNEALHVLKKEEPSQADAKSVRTKSDSKTVKKSEKKSKKEADAAPKGPKCRKVNASPSKRTSESPSKKRSVSPSKRSKSPSKRIGETPIKRKSGSCGRKSKSPLKQRKEKSSDSDKADSSASRPSVERSSKRERSSRNLSKSAEKQSSTRSLLRSSGRSSRGRAVADGNSSSRESSSRRLAGRTSRERGERQGSKRDLLASDQALQKALQIARDKGEKEGSCRRILVNQSSSRHLNGSSRSIVASEISNSTLRQALQKTLDKDASVKCLKKQLSDRTDDLQGDEEKSPDTVSKGSNTLMLALRVRLKNQVSTPPLAQDGNLKSSSNHETKSSFPPSSLRSSMDKSRSTRQLRVSSNSDRMSKSMSARHLGRSLDAKPRSKPISASVHGDVKRVSMLEKSRSSRQVHRRSSTDAGGLFNTDDDADTDGRIYESSTSSRKLRSNSADESRPGSEKVRSVRQLRRLASSDGNESFRRPRRASLDHICGSTQNISMAPVVQLRSSDDEDHGSKKKRPGLQRQRKERKLKNMILTGECSEDFDEPCFASNVRETGGNGSDDSNSRRKAGNTTRWSDSEEKTRRRPGLVRQASTRKLPVSARRDSMGKPPLTGVRDVSFDDFVTNRSNSFRAH